MNDLTTAVVGTSTLASLGNISADPLFVNLAGGDWHLQAGSPLNVREGGQNLIADVSDDKDGVTRTGGLTSATNTNAAGFSMGAYEKD